MSLGPKQPCLDLPVFADQDCFGNVDTGSPKFGKDQFSGVVGAVATVPFGGISGRAMERRGGGGEHVGTHRID